MDSSNISQKLPAVLFKNGVNLLNCVEQSVEFETDDHLLESLNINETENDDSDSDGNQESGDFIEESFKKLWQQLSPVSDNPFIRKNIIIEGNGDVYIGDDSVVKVHYKGYCENSKEPIALTDENEAEIINMKEQKHLMGFMMALKTMRVGETSRFLISHKVMYGDIGCPPLIPAKAMCLFKISVLAVVQLKDRDKGNDDLQTIFQKVYKVARDLHVKGTFFYKKTEYHHAIRLFRHAVRLMESCRLVDDVEEQKQQKFLKKLNMNLAICYNHVNLPLKTCCMCNNLAYLGGLWNNHKALLHSARALSMLGEYKQAERRIKAALSLDPECAEIIKEQKKIQAMKATSDENRHILECNMEFTFKAKQSNSQSNSMVRNFFSAMEKYVLAFKDDEQLFKMDFPDDLTETESDIVIRLLKKHNLYYQCENNVVKYMSKMEIDEKDLPFFKDED